MDRLIKEDADNADVSMEDATSDKGPPLVSPSVGDLPPHASAFRMFDVKREVEKVRDARKRIKLDMATLKAEAEGETQVNGFGPGHGSSAAKPKATAGAALPSICAYTFHDAVDGYAWVA